MRVQRKKKNRKRGSFGKPRLGAIIPGLTSKKMNWPSTLRKCVIWCYLCHLGSMDAVRDYYEYVNEDVDNRDEAAENAGGAAEAVEAVADDHAAEAVPAQEMGADEETTFTPNFLTGVFTWGGIAGLPERRKPVVMQYRAFTKEGPGGEVFFYKIHHL